MIQFPRKTQRKWREANIDREFDFARYYPSSSSCLPTGYNKSLPGLSGSTVSRRLTAARCSSSIRSTESLPEGIVPSLGNIQGNLERDDVSLYGTPKEEIGPFSNFDHSNLPPSNRPGWMRNQLQNIFQPTDNKLAMKLFGSKKALVQERVRQKAAGHWIIHPCSSFRYVFFDRD